MNEDRIDDDCGVGLSNCCEARIIHGDICSACKEHCTAIESDEDGPTEQEIEKMMEPLPPCKVFDEHTAP